MDWLSQAMGHHQRRELAQAEALYREGLRQQPRHPDALHLLGVVRAEQGDCESGAALIREALTLQPGTAVFAQNLASILLNLSLQQRSRAEYDDAARSLREALQLAPDLWVAHLNLGNLLVECGRFEEAEPHLREAHRLQPDRADTAYSLGGVLCRRGRAIEAEALLRRACQDAALVDAAENNLAGCLKDQGRVEEALACYENVLRRQPEWYEAQSNWLNLLTYSAARRAEVVVEVHRRWGQQWSERHAALRQGDFAPWTPERKLRVGYVSPDFRRHAVGYLLEPLLGGHDRTRFEIFAYACTSQCDATTERMRQHIDHWHAIDKLNDAQAATLIRSHGIDVLVDLAGHTAGSRLRLFALRPAPVQATYLGYSYTTGLPEIDYRLTDAAAEPPNREVFHSEKLLRLRRCLIAYAPPEDSPEVSALPVLKKGHITFGSFNRLDKVNEPTLARWAAVLREIKGAHLLLKATPFSDNSFRHEFGEKFRSLGVDPARLEFAPNNQPVAEHLRQFQRVDLGLDTFPFSGSTTTMESLWMGVPVVTLTGDNSMSRMSASLLQPVGLSKLCVATTEVEFVEKAVALASDWDRLATLRAELRSRIQSGELGDGTGLARAMEDAYVRMARCYARGRLERLSMPQ